LLLSIPFVGHLTTKVQARYLIAFGWLCLACGMFYSTQRIDLFISFTSATWLRIAQVVGLGFLFVPITLAAYVGMPAEKSITIAGMVNFMRNIGSSVGTSLVTTIIARRSQYHQSILVGHTTPGTQNFQNAITALTQRLVHSGLSFPDAQRRAYATNYQRLQSQAATLAYVDTFLVLAVGASIMFLLSFFLKKSDPGTGGAAAVG
jgi:DHA2 family multidrug resistance protein